MFLTNQQFQECQRLRQLQWMKAKQRLEIEEVQFGFEQRVKDGNERYYDLLAEHENNNMNALRSAHSKMKDAESHIQALDVDIKAIIKEHKADDEDRIDANNRKRAENERMKTENASITKEGMSAQMQLHGERHKVSNLQSSMQRIQRAGQTQYIRRVNAVLSEDDWERFRKRMFSIFSVET